MMPAYAHGQRAAGAEPGRDDRTERREEAHAQDRDRRKEADHRVRHAELRLDLGQERPQPDELRAERQGHQEQRGQDGQRR